MLSTKFNVKPKLYCFDENSKDTFLYPRMNDLLGRYLEKSSFKTVNALYEFMKISQIYLFGSFALSCLTPIKAHKNPMNPSVSDMDFYIKIKKDEEIQHLIGKIVFYFLNKSYTVTAQLKSDKEYDFLFNKLNRNKVYEITINEDLRIRYKIDLVFGYDDIETLLLTTDFTILQNYISIDNDKPNKFTYNSLHFQDILDRELNITQECVDIVNSYPDIKLSSLYPRLLKYCRRGFAINNIGNNIIDKCCVCIEDEVIMCKEKFNCNHNIVCVNCYVKLADKNCPICRATPKVTPSNITNIITKFYKKHPEAFLQSPNV
jgi:hypothetical protein